jgi:hypothetical protein
MEDLNQRIQDVLDIEIAFHSEVENPWYWRWICKLFRKRECHEVLVNELKFLKMYLKVDKYIMYREEKND